MNAKTLRALLDKLNADCGVMMEAAAGFAASRGHYQITVEHLLLKLLEDDRRLHIDAIVAYFNVDVDRLWQAMIESVNALRSDHQGKPGISDALFQTLEKAVLINTVHYGRDDIDSAALLEAIIELAPVVPGFSGFRELDPIVLEELRQHRLSICQASVEGVQSQGVKARSLKQSASPEAESALAQFTTDLTERAASDDMDPITGRHEEIRMAIDILCRRRKNNPILVGEPGVGKTAVVEGLAQKVVRGEVPALLQNIRIHVLDMGLLQAGAGVKGEFERRLKAVIDEVRDAAGSVMLFIDEAHTLIGAGGEAGLGDAANLLKPALARGELRTIAATTFSEYKQYFEKDPALVRRFQNITVEEPSLDSAILMLNGLRDTYQSHHQVQITDAAIDAAVTLSDRYITGRYLPDKAIDLLDTAAARVRMGQSVVPQQLESLGERQRYLEARIQQLSAEHQQGIAIRDSLLETLQQELQACLQQAADITAQWQQESELVAEIRRQHEHLSLSTESEDRLEELAEASRKLRLDLLAMQTDRPIVQPEVNELAIADVVADWTGVPVGSMSKNDVQSVLTFESVINDSIVGQTLAISAMGQALRASKAGLRTTEGPVGVFLLAGPSGVGKTETARAMAAHLYGSERSLITINMSEYQEAHTVAQLKGSPPGYVGYGQGGVLTEAVRQRPYSVVLLDEVEKAHPDVMNLFYQVFDRGFMRDGEGREIDFKNTLILMTSNLGAEQISQRSLERSHDEQVADIMAQGGTDALDRLAEVSAQAEEPWQPPTLSELQALIKPALLERFAPALLGRMQVIPFVALSEDVLRQIVMLKLDVIAQRLDQQYQLAFRCDEAVLNNLAQQCAAGDTGARYVNALIEQKLMPGIAHSLLQFMAEDDMPDSLTLELNEQGQIDCVYADRPAQSDVMNQESAYA
ncbi:type VI secretion system ATPase TssH [Reinekea blandensis]|uniref:Putative ATPase subunit of ATP-dependent protease n=1 Tax=Reinekea blandensis MED297 TaxID=314283 RepID=A4BEV2_9GAMM|nr:type VI secretion system ATPase TssH [Reinekea blandensis]EAR09287.1 putative ATPase subunit of ATP-dependent protease [Reinekea sp. MED297] [Reinekea blandensis MED297]